MILLLPPLDALEVMICELSAPSEEFLGLSDTGDLIDSLRGCLLNEALIDRGIHFEPPEFDFCFSSTESDCLHVLERTFSFILKRRLKNCKGIDWTWKIGMYGYGHHASEGCKSISTNHPRWINILDLLQ